MLDFLLRVENRQLDGRVPFPEDEHFFFQHFILLPGLYFFLLVPLLQQSLLFPLLPDLLENYAFLFGPSSSPLPAQQFHRLLEVLSRASSVLQPGFLFGSSEGLLQREKLLLEQGAEGFEDVLDALLATLVEVRRVFLDSVEGNESAVFAPRYFFVVDRRGSFCNSLQISEQSFFDLQLFRERTLGLQKRPRARIGRPSFQTVGGVEAFLGGFVPNWEINFRSRVGVSFVGALIRE